MVLLALHVFLFPLSISPKGGGAQPFLRIWAGCLFPGVREKENPEVVVKVKLKSWPWLASAWQNSMHLEAREVSTSATAVILTSFLN